VRRLLALAAAALVLAGCNRLSVWRPPAAGAEQPEVVVLIHAIWRWPGYSMRRLWQEGIRRGYEVVYFRYSGLLTSLEANTDRLADVLEEYRGRRVNFVTHSYGGLIARNLLERLQTPDVDRLVMIGTPNQGSNFALRWCRTVPYRIIFGLGGLQLTPNATRRLAVPDCEFGIIAGTGSEINPYTVGENDGVVGVTEAYLPGAREFRVVPSAHEALQNNPVVVEAAYQFLEEGTFGLDPI
jgi:pimeloyl-ACP methyl ester carboxylesterase